MDTLENQIEKLIDERGIARFIDALAYVCFAKSEHVETNWQDKHLSLAWYKVGQKLENIVLSEVK